MSQAGRTQFVRVRAEFDASPSTGKVLNRFYRVPKSRFRFHSSIHRIISAAEYGRTEFQKRRKFLEDNLVPELARHALTLADPVRLQSAGAVDKFLFDVENPEVLDTIHYTLQRLPADLSTQGDKSVGVTMERNRYKEDIDQLRSAREALLVAARTKNDLRISRARIVYDPLYFSHEAGRLMPVDPDKI